MMSLRMTASALAVCLLCSSCGKASRDCPAFYHPSAKELTPISIGNALTFSSNIGTSVSYTLKSIEKNEPFTAYARGGHFIPVEGRASNIECELKETHIYESAELGIILTHEFTQFDEPGSATENQAVKLTVQFLNSDESKSRFFIYSPTSWMVSDGSDELPVSRIYYPERVVNQFVYPDISETKYVNELVWPEDDSLSEIQVNRVALSYGFGLIEYELLDGTVFSLLR